ncbi:hypothetical protein ACWEIJ_36135 [Lentzea sp. NPDC004789]
MASTIRRAIGLAAAGAAVVVGLTGAPALATTPDHNTDEGTVGVVSTNARVEQDVQAVLRLNPGSHRITTNVVEVGKGVRISVPVQVNSVLGCATHWLCLSEHANFGGYQISFEACRNENLGNYHMPDGRSWNDQVSSIRNAQSGGVQSRFYNYSGSGDPNDSRNWNFVIALNSGHYLRDLSRDTSADGGNANDKIDIVHVC